LTAHGSDLNRGVLLEGATPRHQFGLHTMFDIGTDVDVDAELRHSTPIRRRSPTGIDEGVPAYGDLNLRVAWRPAPALEAAILGQNLLHDHHPEFGPPGSRGEIQRGVYASITWRR
jgi:iron complex outermembrane receptor protein